MYTYTVILTHPTEGDCKMVEVRAHSFAETEARIQADYEDWNIHSITHE